MLIAFLVSAGVAASVFIQSSNTLQIQSLKTGRQTTEELASGLKVNEIIGQKGDYGIHYLGILVQLKPGSPPVNLNNSFILISEGNQKSLLHYGGYNNPDIFKNPARGDYFEDVLEKIRECTRESFGIGVLQDADNSITQTNPVLTKGDKAILYVVCDEYTDFLLYTGGNGQDGPLFGTTFLPFESSDNMAYYDEEVNDNEDYDNTEDIFIDYHDGGTYSPIADQSIAGTEPDDGTVYSNLNSSDGDWSLDSYNSGGSGWSSSSDFIGFDDDLDEAYTAGQDILVAGTRNYLSAGLVLHEGQHPDWTNEGSYGIDSYDENNGDSWDETSDFLGQDLDQDGAYTSAADQTLIGTGNEPPTGTTLTPGEDPDWTINSYDKNNGGNWDNNNDLLAIDNDSDGAYTDAVDVLIDADGDLTSGSGSTSLSSGDSLYDIESDDLIVADNLISPSIVWQDSDNDSKYTDQADIVLGGVAPPVQTILETSNPFTTAPIISFVDQGTSNLWESGNDLIIQDDDKDGVYTSSADLFIDNDGIITTGAGSQDISTAGTQLFSFSSSDDIYWFDNDSSSDWSSGDGLWLSGGVENNIFNSSEGDDAIILGNLNDGSSIGVELDNGNPVDNFAYAEGGGYSSGKDIFYENVAGELTYSSGADSIIAGSGTTPDSGDTLITSNPFTDAPQIAFYDDGSTIYEDGNDAIIRDYHNGGTYSDSDETVVLGIPSDGETGINVASTPGWVKENNNIWNPGEDIFIEQITEMFTYSREKDMIIAGTPPSGGTPYTSTNAFDGDWTQLKSYDANDNGGNWDSSTDCIIIDNHGDHTQHKYSATADTSIAGNPPVDGEPYDFDNAFDHEWTNLLTYNRNTNGNPWNENEDAIILDTYGDLSKNRYSDDADTRVAGSSPPDGTSYTVLDGFVVGWDLDTYDKYDDGGDWSGADDFIGIDLDRDTFVTRQADVLIDGDGNFSNGTGASEGSVNVNLSLADPLTDLEDIYGSGAGLYYYDDNHNGFYDINEDIILDTTFNNPVNHLLDITGFCFLHELEERIDVFGRVIPEIGSPGVISFTTPKAYTDGVFKLQ